MSSIPTRALVIPTRACIATPSAKRLAHSADAHLCRSLSFAPSRFGFARVHGDGMVLAAAPKQAMVWGFCDEGAAVTVSLDGGANTIKATIGPDQATGALTTWRVLYVDLSPSPLNMDPQDAFCLKLARLTGGCPFGCALGKRACWARTVL